MSINVLTMKYPVTGNVISQFGGQPFKQSGRGMVITIDSNQQLLLLFMLIETWY